MRSKYVFFLYFILSIKASNDLVFVSTFSEENTSIYYMTRIDLSHNTNLGIMYAGKEDNYPFFYGNINNAKLVRSRISCLYYLIDGEEVDGVKTITKYFFGCHSHDNPSVQYQYTIDYDQMSDIPIVEFLNRGICIMFIKNGFITSKSDTEEYSLNIKSDIFNCDNLDTNTAVCVSSYESKLTLLHCTNNFYNIEKSNEIALTDTPTHIRVVGISSEMIGYCYVIKDEIYCGIAIYKSDNYSYISPTKVGECTGENGIDIKIRARKGYDMFFMTVIRKGYKDIDYYHIAESNGKLIYNYRRLSNSDIIHAIDFGYSDYFNLFYFGYIGEVNGIRYNNRFFISVDCTDESYFTKVGQSLIIKLMKCNGYVQIDNSKGKLFLYDTGASVDSNKIYDVLKTTFYYIADKAETISIPIKLSVTETGEQTESILSITSESSEEICYDTCKECDEIGNKDEHKCTLCKSDFYKVEGDLKGNCYSELEGYYLDKVEQIFKKCDKPCMTCTDKEICLTCEDNYYFLYPNRCVKQCERYHIEKENECVNCRDSNKYLLYTLEKKECVNEIINGYYVDNAEYNLLKECKYNCATTVDSEEYKLFCAINAKTCLKIISMDETLQLNHNPLRDNTEILVDFSSLEEKQKEETVTELITNIDSSDFTAAINDIVLANQMINTTNDNETIYNILLSKISSILSCDEIKQLFIRESKGTVLSTALALYYTISHKDTIKENDLIILSLINNCIIEYGNSNFIGNEDNNELYQDDFTNTLSNTVDKMIFILDNITHIDPSYNETSFHSKEYQYNNSIVDSPSRNQILTSIRNISYMVSKYNNSEKYNYQNVHFVSYYIDNLAVRDYQQSNILLTTRQCDSIAKDVTIKFCFPYSEIKRKYPQAYQVSVVSYSKYPLLNQNVTEHFSKNFSSIEIRDKNSNIIKVSNLEERIKMIIKKPYSHFNECLFYSEEDNHLSSTGCIAENFNSDYLLCSCTHLTDFTISDLNPLLLFNDIKKVLTQARIITSFDVFRNLTWKNATVLYTIGAILFIFIIMVVYTMKKDLGQFKNSLIIIVPKAKSCCSKDEVLDDINELDTQIKIIVYNKSPKEIELPTLNTAITSQQTESNDIDGNNNNQKQELIKGEDQKNFIVKEYSFIFGSFFKKEYWFCCLFMSGNNEITKTNFLIIFITKLISSLALTSIFAECSSKDSENSFNNRDLAVAVLTVFLNEIPFTIFEVLLTKTKIYRENLAKVGKYRKITLFRYCLVYFIFVNIVVFAIINTTWISLDSEKNNFDCRFLQDFFISIVLDCFLYQILILCLKALLYFFILKGNESSCLKGCLLCLVSSLPWVFSIYS